MKPRRVGFAVLVVLLALLVVGYLRTGRDAGESPDPPQRAGEAGADNLDALRATRRDLEERVARLQDLTRAQRAPARVLDRVALALPDLVSLERLSLREKSVTIAGEASDTHAIANFLEALGDTRGFGEPETRSITTSRDGYRFALDLLIDPGVFSATASEDDPPPEPAARSGPLALSGDGFKASIGELQAQLDGLLPAARQTDDVLRRIRTLALRSEVVLLTFRPREILDGDSYRRWPIDISVEAPYYGLVSFLDQIGRIGLVVPGDLDVVATRGGSGITATLVLSAYLRPRGESETSGEPRDRPEG